MGKKMTMALLGALLAGGLMAPAQAQLVNVHTQYKVVQVDPGHNRLVVESLGQKGNMPQWFVDCNGDTQVSYNGHPISWQQVRAGDVIEVNGGVSWNGHIKGKSITDVGFQAGE